MDYLQGNTNRQLALFRVLMRSLPSCLSLTVADIKKNWHS